MIKGKKKRIRTASILLGAFFSLSLSVSSSYASNRVLTAEATKSNYWSSFIANNTSNLTKGGEALLEALSTKISTNVKTLSYDGLWTAYKSTDIIPGTSSSIWDMYGGFAFAYGSKQCGNYKSEGACYNREHSIPKSWFSEKSPMYSDIVHLVPTDGKVNGMRSNYPFGEVANATYSYSFPERSAGGVVYQTAGVSKLGSGKAINGVSAPSIVFEPDDQYKGDFARIYMYFVTRYKGVATVTEHGQSTFKSTYPYLTSYGLALLKKWHEEDPVSEKEIARNDGIESVQGNRNPFVDYPEWANKIFGTSYVDEKLEKLTMNTNSEYLPYGSTLQLSVTPTPSDASSLVSWTSSNSNVASVTDDGLVTIGNETGYALITATSLEDSSIKAYCNITSYAPSDIDVTSITAVNISLTVGETKPIEVSYSPSDSYPIPTYSYEYDDTYINVDSNGNIKALKEGNVSLIINAYQGGVKRCLTQCVITIAGEKEAVLGDSVTIVFKTADSDGSADVGKDDVLSTLVSEGASYISNVTGATKLYQGKTGIKMGSSSASGLLSISLSDDIKNKDVAGIGLNSSAYSKDTGTLDIYINGSETKSNSFTPGDEKNNTWKSSSVLSLSSLTIKTSKDRAYLTSITIFFAGDGGEDTSYDADDFANEFYNAINCDVLGINKPSFKDGYSWSSLKGLYESISLSSEKEKLINASYDVAGSGSGTIITPLDDTSMIVAMAVYRYDYIINKYNRGTVTYEPFIEGRESSFNDSHYLLSFNDNALTLTIIIISFLSLNTLICLTTILNRKKQKER